MTKQEILDMTGLTEDEFYAQYPTEESFQMAMGGMVDEYKKGGWIQKATASIKRRGTEGVCTGSNFGGPSCRPGTRRYNLAKTFRKMAKARKKEDGGMVDMYEDGEDPPYTSRDRAQDSTLYADINIPFNMRKILLGDTFGSYEEIGSAEDYGSDPSVEEMIAHMRDPRASGYSHARQAAINAFRNKGAAGKLYLTNDEVAKIAKRFQDVDKEGKYTTPNNPMYGSNSYDLKATLSAPDYWRVMQEIKRNKSKKADGGVVDAYQLMGMPTPSMYGMGGETGGPFEDSVLDMSSMEGMSIGEIKNELKNNSEQAKRNIITYDLNYINNLKDVLTPEEKFNLELAYRRNLKNWNVGATGKVDYNRTINPESKSSVIQRNVNLGITGGYQGPNGSTLSGEINYNPTTKTWGGSAKGSIAFKEGGSIMYGMGGYAPIGKYPHVMSRQNLPNMGMAYGGMVPAYKKGGFLNTLGDIGYGIADVGLGAVGSVTGIKSMQDIIDEDQYSDDKFDNVTNTIGKVGGTALKIIPVTAPFAAAAGAVGNVVNKTAGIDAKNYDPSKHTSSWDKIGDTVEGLGGMASMAMGNIGGAANQVGQLGKAAEVANKITKGASMANSGLNFGNSLSQGQFDLNSLMNIYGGLQGLPTGFAMGGQVNYPEGLQMADGSYVPMMSRPTTDRLLSNRSANRIPTFAMGGQTEMTEGELEVGENLNVQKNGSWKTVTKYESGGMGRHSEDGSPKPEQVVPLPVGGSIASRRFKKLDDLATSTNDELLKNTLHGYKHNGIMFPGKIEIAKRKKEAKEQQLAMLEEQKAAKAMNRMVAKYGGAIQRMYANGGMVPKYQDASWVTGDEGFDFATQGQAPLSTASNYWSEGSIGPTTNTGLWNLFNTFSNNPTRPSTDILYEENMRDIGKPIPTQPRVVGAPFTGQGPLKTQVYNPTYNTGLLKGIPTSAAQTTPASNPRPYGMSNQTDVASKLKLNNPSLFNYDMSAFTTPTTTFSGSAGFGSTPSSLNLDTSPMTMGQYLTGQSGSYMDPKNIPDTGIGYKGEKYKTPNTGGANYSDLISTGLPYALAASQVVEPLLQKPFSLKASDYQTPADTKWEDMTGESGRRDMLRAYNLAKYNARQIGGSGALAALQAGSTGYQQALAAYNEGLENKNKLGKFEAAKFNKAIQQGNLGLAMQIAQFNEQNKAARRNAIRQGAMNLAGTAYNQQANQMTKEGLSAAYPDYQFSWNKKRG